MSVGGRVIETIDTGDKVWVNTNDKHSECAVYVERSAESRSISEGDMLWWQAGVCYWTPYDGMGNAISPIERPLTKVGYSGVNRPANAGSDASASSPIASTDLVGRED